MSLFEIAQSQLAQTKMPKSELAHKWCTKGTVKVCLTGQLRGMFPHVSSCSVRMKSDSFSLIFPCPPCNFEFFSLILAFKKYSQPSNPASRYIPQRTENLCSNISSCVFTAAVGTVAQRWTQPKCSSTDERIKENVIYPDKGIVFTIKKVLLCGPTMKI